MISFEESEEWKWCRNSLIPFQKGKIYYSYASLPVKEFQLCNCLVVEAAFQDEGLSLTAS